MQDKTGIKNILKTLIVTILSLVILFFFLGIKSERERKEKVSIILSEKTEDQKNKEKLNNQSSVIISELLDLAYLSGKNKIPCVEVKNCFYEEFSYLPLEDLKSFLETISHVCYLGFIEDKSEFLIFKKDNNLPTEEEKIWYSFVSDISSIDLAYSGAKLESDCSKIYSWLGEDPKRKFFIDACKEGKWNNYQGLIKTKIALLKFYLANLKKKN